MSKFLDQKGVVPLFLPVLVLVFAAVLVSSNVQVSSRFDGQDVKGLIAKNDDNGDNSSGSSGSDRSGSSGNSNSNSDRGNSSEQRIRQEIRTSDERIKTEIREDKIRIDVSQGGIRNRIQQRGNEFLIKTKIEMGDEATDSGDEDEATPSADEGDVVQELRAISKFPLRIDLATNQLIMTKNGVSRVLTVLPAHAVQNMLRAHLKKGLGPKFFTGATPSAQPSASASASPSATASATPIATTSATPSPTATPSASPTAEAVTTEATNLTISESQISLEEKDGQIVYKIPAKKHLRILGLFPVNTDLTGFVSAETGVLLEEQESLLARILDFLSP